MVDPNRRPLKSRNTAIAQRIARWLAGTPVTPNQISAMSVVFAALAGLGFWISAFAGEPLRSLILIAVALCIQLRLLCNLFDGMVAIEGGKSSATGAFWNEFPDRPSDIVIFVGMGLGAGNALLGWAAAALAVLTSYVRELGKSAGCQPDFSGPMAKQQRMAVATVAAALEIPLAIYLSDFNILEIALWIIIVGCILTALRRTRSLLQCLGDE